LYFPGWLKEELKPVFSALTSLAQRMNDVEESTSKSSQANANILSTVLDTVAKIDERVGFILSYVFKTGIMPHY